MKVSKILAFFLAFAQVCFGLQKPNFILMNMDDVSTLLTSIAEHTFGLRTLFTCVSNVRNVQLQRFSGSFITLLKSLISVKIAPIYELV